MSGDGYIKVPALLSVVNKDSVRLCNPLNWAQGSSVPRSLLHGSDDMALDGRPCGTVYTFRIREWKAKALGMNRWKEK